MSGEHILIVEDEEDIAELLEYNLQRHGYLPSSVSTGEDGLNQSRETNPDLILLDLMLPGLSGLEVCRRLKGDRATEKIPVIMLTAKGEEEDLNIHPGRHQVTAAGKQIDLTRTEFRILHFLASRPGWVFTRGQIVRSVHGDDYPVTGRSVDVQIAALRRKLGQAGNLIRTVRGIGYKMGE